MNFSLSEIRTFFLLEDAMNKKTTALTTEQYREIITTMKEGGAGFRPNERIATALVLEYSVLKNH